MKYPQLPLKSGATTFSSITRPAVQELLKLLVLLLLFLQFYLVRVLVVLVQFILGSYLFFVHLILLPIEKRDFFCSEEDDICIVFSEDFDSEDTCKLKNCELKIGTILTVSLDISQGGVKIHFPAASPIGRFVIVKLKCDFLVYL